MNLVMTKTVGEIAAENPGRIPLLEEFLEIHGLTNDLMPPTDACGSYRVLFQGLLALEKDFHRHVHLENNVLFQKAVVAGILD